MQAKVNKMINEALNKALLNEAEKAKDVSPDECDKIIGEIRRKLIDLNNKFMQMGIDKGCKPFQQIRKMNHILAGLDPVEINMAQYFVPKTETAATAMVEQEEEDFKMKFDTDTQQQKKGVEMANKFGMDVELTD